MTQKETYLFLEMIMIDIRMSWDRQLFPLPKSNFFRKRKSLKLAKDLTEIGLVGVIYLWNWYSDDGRWLRGDYPNGYEGMDKLHSYPMDSENRYIIMDSTKEFRRLVKKYLRCPEIYISEHSNKLLLNYLNA